MTIYHFNLDDVQGILPLDNEHLAEDVILYLEGDATFPMETIWILLPEESGKLEFLSKTILTSGTYELVILTRGDVEFRDADFSGFSRVLITDHEFDNEINIPVIKDAQKQSEITLRDVKAQELYLLGTNFKIFGGFIKNILKIYSAGDKEEIRLFGREDSPLIIGYLTINGSDTSIALIKHVNITRGGIEGEVDVLKTKFLTLSNKVESWSITSRVFELHPSLKEESAPVMIDPFVGNINFTWDADEILLGSFMYPRGEFLISPGVKVSFLPDVNGRFAGASLTINTPNAETLTLPICNKMEFSKIIINHSGDLIIGALEVVARNIEIQGAFKVDFLGEVSAEKLIKTSDGYIKITSPTISYLCISGKNKIMLGSRGYHIDFLEIKGGGDLSLLGAGEIDLIKQNLDVDTDNISEFVGIYGAGGVGVKVYNNHTSKPVIIKNIYTKSNKMYFKGEVELGKVFCELFKDDTSIFHSVISESQLKFGVFIYGGIKIVDDESGTRIIPLDMRVYSSRAKGQVLIYAQKDVSSESIFAAHSTGMLSFWGSVDSDSGDVAFRSMGDMLIRGRLHAGRYLITEAIRGSLDVEDSDLQGKSVVSYGSSGVYVACTTIAAEEYLVSSLYGDVMLTDLDIVSKNLVLLSEHGKIDVIDSKLSSEVLSMAGVGTEFYDSKIISCSVLVKTLSQVVLSKTDIDIRDKKYFIFADRLEKLAKPVSTPEGSLLLGLFYPDRAGTLTDLTCERINSSHLSKEEIEALYVRPNTIYLDSSKCSLIGSSLTGAEQVIIRGKDSIEIIPLRIYNHIMVSGGFTEESATILVSGIQAGLIDIESSKVITIVKSVLSATYGRVAADKIEISLDMNDLKLQQNRMGVLRKWLNDEEAASILIPEHESIRSALRFTEVTDISCRVGVDLLAPFSSKNLIYTRREGDILLDKDVEFPYESLVVNVERGKVLIKSPDIFRVHEEASMDRAKDAAETERTVIGANNLYIEADIIKSEAGIFEVKGELKLVGREGVDIVPVQLYKRLHEIRGSKTTIDQEVAHQIISEIRAGHLEIKSSREVKLVSSFIKSHFVDIDAESLLIGAEKEIIEKNVYFRGAKKPFAGRNKSWSHEVEETVVPTMIETDRLNTRVTGKTTIEAAQMLVREEGTMESGAGILFLAKYNIYIYDQHSKKSYLFDCHKGKLKVASTKTIREHFCGEAPIPTIYHSQGSFFCFSEGQIHSMGAKIVGSNIYLASPKGVKLEAAPYKTEHFVSISERGVRTGFFAGSVGSESFMESIKESMRSLRYDSPVLRADNTLVIDAGESDVELKGAVLEGGRRVIKARNVIAETAEEEYHYESRSEAASSGLYFGVQTKLGGLAHAGGRLLKGGEAHYLNILDKALNARSFYKESESLRKWGELKPDGSGVYGLRDILSAGIFFGASHRVHEVESHNIRSVDNIIKGGTLQIIASGAVDIEGIEAELEDFEVAAESFAVKASVDKEGSSSRSFSLNLQIPIASIDGLGPLGTEFSTGSREGSSERISHHSDNKITVRGNFKLDLAGDGKIIGVDVTAEHVDVRAQNLFIESVQDRLSERMRGFTLSISLTGSGGMIMPTEEKGGRSAEWTRAFGQLVGTQIVNVALAESLHLAGGLVARAEIGEDGSLRDGGDMHLEAASIIASRLHDYDHGRSYALGLGLAMSKGSDGKAEFGLGEKMRVRYELDRGARMIEPASGGYLSTSSGALYSSSASSIPVEGVTPSSVEYARIEEASRERGGIDADLPLSEMISAIRSFLLSRPVKAEKLTKTEEEREGLKGVVEKAAEVTSESEFVEYGGGGGGGSSGGIPEEISEIYETLSKYVRIPEPSAPEEAEQLRVVLHRIASYIDKEYRVLSREERANIIAISFNLGENLSRRPGLIGAESIGVSAGAPLAVSGYFALAELLGLAAGAAIIKLASDAAAKYVLERDSGDIERIDRSFREHDEIEERRAEEYRTRDKSEGSKHKLGFKDSAISGMPDPDDEDGERREEGVATKERKFGVPKGESPIWKELKPYREGIRTNGLKGTNQRFYEWDHLHNEVEVYGPRGKVHLGAMDPVTGKMIKSGVPGRNIVGLLK